MNAQTIEAIKFLIDTSETLHETFSVEVWTDLEKISTDKIVLASHEAAVRITKATAHSIDRLEIDVWMQKPGFMRQVAQINLGTPGGNAWGNYLNEVLFTMDTLGVSERELFAGLVGEENLPLEGSRELDKSNGIGWRLNGSTLYVEFDENRLPINVLNCDGRSEKRELVIDDMLGDRPQMFKQIQALATKRCQNVYARWLDEKAGFMVEPE